MTHRNARIAALVALGLLGDGSSAASFAHGLVRVLRYTVSVESSTCPSASCPEEYALRIVSVVGARPQFITAAPVCRSLCEAHEEILVHSGQHHDHGMSRVFFEELGIPAPDCNLEVSGGGHGAMIGQTLGLLDEFLVVPLGVPAVRETLCSEWHSGAPLS